MHKKTKNLPFPAGEGGRGDRGRKGKLRAWSAGGKEGKPPFRHYSGRVTRQPKPPRPPPGTTAARRGKPPRRKPTFSFPFPTQEGKTFPQPVEKRVEKHAAWYAVLLMRKPFSHFFAVFRHDSTAAGVWKRPHGARKLHLLPARSEQPGKNTGGYRPHISRSISWYPSAAERLSAASACAQASTAADRTPGSAARATRRYSLT